MLISFVDGMVFWLLFRFFITFINSQTISKKKHPFEEGDDDIGEKRVIDSFCTVKKRL